MSVATNTAVFKMLMSGDNGATWKAGTDYSGGVNYSAWNSATVNNSNNQAFFPLTGPCYTDRYIDAQLWVTGCNHGYYISMHGDISYFDTTLTQMARGTFVGTSDTTGINALRFIFSSGNISYGVFSLYTVR